MNKKAAATFLSILISALALSACSAAATPAASSPITLTTKPNPPQRGPVEFIVEVKDTQGQPLDDAQVLILASHSGMGGMNWQSLAKPMGQGRYALTADLSGMSGQWLVTVQASKGALNLAQDFKINVE
jgi:hypothetical protein